MSQWTQPGRIVTGLVSVAVVAAAMASMTGSQRAQSLGLTQHGSLVTAQDAGAADSVATVAVSPGTAGQVLTVSDAGLPHWAAASGGGGLSISAGVDTSRPTATAAGAIYTATDTGTRYLSESDGVGGFRWRVVSSGLLDNARIGVAATGQAPLGVVSRAAPTTGTLVLFFGGSALPVSVVQLAGNFSGGLQIEIGDSSGDRGLLSLYRPGLTPTRASLTGATITGSLSTLHAIAIALDGSEARWSFDGGAVQTQAYTGTPSGSGPWWIGGPSTVYASGLYSAFRVLGEKADDADLVTLTDATARAAYRIPAVSSATTIVVDWHASRAPLGVLAREISGTQSDIMYSTAAPRGGSW